jgi:O-antigen biosynthesis protein
VTGVGWLDALLGRWRGGRVAAWPGPGTLAVVGQAPTSWTAVGVPSTPSAAAARAEWLVYVAPGFAPAPDALPALAAALADDAEVDFVFGDELEPDGHWHKPGWSPALLLAQPYAATCFVVRRALAAELGDAGAATNAAARYDLSLRATAAARRVRHVPAVLGHTAAPMAPSPAHAEAAARAAAAAGLTAQIAPRPGSLALDVSVRPHRPTTVQVLVPTRDRLDLVQPCVDSVLATTGDEARVLIVDNGSAEPATLAWLAAVAGNPRVTVLRDDRPFDYAALMNRAVAQSTAEHVLLLNNDTRVIAPDWLAQLSGWLAAPGVAAAGAKLYYGDDTVQHAGVLVGVGGVASHGHKGFPRASAGYHGLLHSVRDVSAATGACLLVRRDDYLAVGGMAGELRVAYNDVDLCLRLRARGRRIVWTPRAELHHFEGRSRGTDKVRTQRFEQEIAYMRAHWPRELAGDPFFNPNLSDRHVDYRRRSGA